MLNALLISASILVQLFQPSVSSIDSAKSEKAEPIAIESTVNLACGNCRPACGCFQEDTEPGI